MAAEVIMTDIDILKEIEGADKIRQEKIGARESVIVNLIMETKSY